MIEPKIVYLIKDLDSDKYLEVRGLKFEPLFSSNQFFYNLEEAKIEYKILKFDKMKNVEIIAFKIEELGTIKIRNE